MAGKKLQGDWGLRIQILEARVDYLEGHFEEANLQLLDLKRRVEKVEIWCKQMQEGGQFVYDPKIQEHASSDKTAEPTQVLSDTVGKKDESVYEIAVPDGSRLEEADIIVLEKKIQEVSVAVDTVEELLEMESSRSAEGAALKAEGTTQVAGLLERGSVDETEEFKDENREQEELRQREKPDESREPVRDLAATLEKRKRFGPGAEELGEDSVELDTAEGSATALSERIRIGEGAEDIKRGDEEKGNEYQLEALEVEGCDQEGRLAEEAEEQETGEDVEQTEHDDITEPAKAIEYIGEATLESSEEMEKSLSGERRKQEKLAKSKTMEEDNKEKNKELQLAGTERCTEEASEQAESGLCEVAGKEEEVVGSKIQVEEKKEPDSELEVPELEKGFAGATPQPSKDSEGQVSEQAKQKNVTQSKVEETLELITVHIEEETDMRLSDKLRRNIDEHIRKLVESSVTEINQKVHALESEAREHNRVKRSLKDELERLQTELLSTVNRNRWLKQEINDLRKSMNAQMIKQRDFEKSNQELIAKCRQATADVEEAMAHRVIASLDLESKQEEFKAKYSAGKEQTRQADVGTSKEKDGQMSVEGAEENLASFVQLKWHLEDSIVRAVGILPMEVKKDEKDEAPDECCRALLERLQDSPDVALKAMEAVLREQKEKHDCVWKEILNELKLSMHDVASAGCPSLTNQLLGYGVSCNEVDKGGNTPLHHAARSGIVDVGIALLSAGSHVNSQNLSKETPLHVALKHGNIKFSLMLLNEDVDVELGDANATTPLHLATLRGSTVIVELLIEDEADVNAVDLDGDTPMCNAAIEGNVLIGENLLRAGAEISTPNNDGLTPLHGAAWHGNVAFCFFLLNQGASVDPMNSMNLTPLHLAAMENHGNTVQLLITRGARVNCLEERTDSPLHYAAKFGDVSVTKALLRAGANVLAINGEGRTPLHVAAAKGHTEICSLLINAKSDVNALDERNRTPLHMVAMYGGSISVAEILVRKGANLTVVDCNGLTPSDLGYAFDNLEFTAWLEERILAREGRREKGARRKKGNRGKK